jgi:uncharacterized membrane protein
LIGPVVMLLGGVAAGVVLWRVLMEAPAPTGALRATAPERLSRQDRHALDRLLDERGRP